MRQIEAQWEIIQKTKSYFLGYKRIQEFSTYFSPMRPQESVPIGLCCRNAPKMRKKQNKNFWVHRDSNPRTTYLA